jgi:Ca2+-transporting ATPase
MYLMAQKNAVINRLPAVETLGATGIIFSDKTGTLTQNEMTLDTLATEQELYETGQEGEAKDLTLRLLRTASLCCNADLANSENEEASGDPEEISLLRACQDFGIELEELRTKHPRLDEAPFQHETMKMATLHESDNGTRLLAVKGAPEAVFEACSQIAVNGRSTNFDDSLREDWDRKSTELAESGLRLLAVAEKDMKEDSLSDQDPYKDLTLLGLVGFSDPPREGTKETVDACQAAGISVEMITGDQPHTAKAIAESVGIVGGPDDPEARVMLGSELEDVDSLSDEMKEKAFRSNIFARVEPQQKLGLVKLYQERGQVVAMTGDGINDAPALKKADIGVAMGVRGTEAAKQVADMVLEDDRLQTMVAAVKQGRVIFDNIRKSIMFMLCTNVAEVIAVATASFLGWTLPLLPLQILYLNLLTDVFPALALGVGPGREGVMDEASREPGEAVLTRRHWTEIGSWSVLIAACVLGSLKLAQNWLGLSDPASITVAFLTLGFSKLWFTFNLRDPQSGVFKNEVTRNPWVWASIVFCAGLLGATVGVGFLSDLLKTTVPTAEAWGLILGGSLIPFVVGQIVRLVQGKSKKGQDAS